MKKPSLRDRMRFWFDGVMSRSRSQWFLLFLLIGLAALVVGAIRTIGRINPEGEEPAGFFEAFWQTLASLGVSDGSAGWPYRILMSAVVIGNIFIGSAVFVLVWVFVENALNGLRKGRSRVLAKDHTVILNWSPAIFDVISELVVANASRRRPRIAILANKDKAEMDDEIAERLTDLGNTKISTRTGDPTDLTDLGIMSLQTARSIIVLSPEDEDGNPDSHVIKSIWAVVQDPERRGGVYNVTAEIQAPKNVDVARAVGGEGLQVVLADDLLARVLVQTVRQAGLSSVYSDLLDFEGCEIYTVRQPDLCGKNFDFAVMAYERCVPIGLCDEQGDIHLNPPGATHISDGHRLIIVAEDDSMIQADPSRAAIVEQVLREPTPHRDGVAERTLMLGWNRRGPIVARELSTFAAPGSVLTIAADTPDVEDEIASWNDISEELEIQFRRIDTADSSQLDSLDVPSYDHVLVLGYSDMLPAQPADTQTMITLLHLRQIADKADHRINVASEMIDIRNRKLAEVTRADDFVVSNKLVSQMLAQASENATISAIFEDLFNEAGSELYLRPVSEYVTVERPVDFYTISEAARRRGQIALGYRLLRDTTGGVVINPVKTLPVQYQDGDQIVVLAES